MIEVFESNWKELECLKNANITDNMEAWWKGRQSTHSFALSLPHFCRHYKLEKSFFDLKEKRNGMSSPFAPVAVASLLLQAGGVKSQELQRQKNVGTKIRKQVLGAGEEEEG